MFVHKNSDKKVAIWNTMQEWGGGVCEHKKYRY